MMKYAETFVVDLNDVIQDEYLVVSLEHTREHGRGVTSPCVGLLRPGDVVTIYSGDDGMVWEAEVVKDLDHDRRYLVTPRWDTGRQLHDMDERVSLHGNDPHEVLRAMLRTPAS